MQKKEYHLDISRQNNFDLVRLFAAVQVMLWHGLSHFDLVHQHYHWFVPLFQLPGVPIFFALSGFLISQSWQNRPDIKRYATNRLLRIYPALWLCLALTVLAISISQCVDLNHMGFFKWVLMQLTVGQAYNTEILRCWGTGVPNGSLWSITVELQFYAILPLLWFVTNALPSKRLKNLFWVSVFGASVVYCWGLDRADLSQINQKILGISVFSNLHFFVLGILVFQNFEVLYPYFKQKIGYWLLVYAVFTAGALYVRGFERSVYDLDFQGITSNILLVGVVFSAAYSSVHLSQKWLKSWDLSYGIYIYHMLVFNVVYHATKTISYIELTVLCGIVMGLAALSWGFIESPILKLKSRI